MDFRGAIATSKEEHCLPSQYPFMAHGKINCPTNEAKHWSHNEISDIWYGPKLSRWLKYGDKRQPGQLKGRMTVLSGELRELRDYQKLIISCDSLIRKRVNNSKVNDICFNLWRIKLANISSIFSTVIKFSASYIYSGSFLGDPSRPYISPSVPDFIYQHIWNAPASKSN